MSATVTPRSISARKRNPHYVDNKEFFRAICAYQDVVAVAVTEERIPPKIPRYIADCVMKISQKLAHRPNFANYSYRDDMVADAIENMIGYGVSKFDRNRTQNPFAYFTQIAWNAFRLRIQKEKKEAYVKYKTMENMYVNGEWADSQEGDDSVGGKSPSTTGAAGVGFREHVNEFVRGYETAQEAKKAKKRTGALDKLLEEQPSNDNGNERTGTSVAG